MRSFILKTINNGFIRRVVTLQLGSFSGTFTQALLGVFIARILQPELFGIYTLSFAMASMLSLLVGAGIQEASGALLGSAHARWDKKEATDIISFALKITLFAALATILIGFFVPTLANHFYGLSDVGVYALYIVGGVIFSSLIFASTSIVLQVGGFIKQFSLLFFLDSALRFGLSLLLVSLGYGVLGVVLGQMLGAILIALVSLGYWNRASRLDSLLPSFSEAVSNIGQVSVFKYLRFTFWVAADRNLATLFSSLPVLIAGFYLTSSDVTFFKLALGYVSLALSLLGPISVLLNVEFPRINVLSRSNLLPTFVKVSLYSTILSFVVTLGALIVSPLAFQILYGEAFLPGAYYSWGLIIYGLVYGLGVGLGAMWRAIDRVKISLLINIITLGIGVPLGLWLVKTYGPWGATTMVTIWFALSHITSFTYLVRYLKKSETLPIN